MGDHGSVDGRVNGQLWISEGVCEGSCCLSFPVRSGLFMGLLPISLPSRSYLAASLPSRSYWASSPPLWSYWASSPSSWSYWAGL